MFRLLCISFILILINSGCRLGPSYCPPTPEAPKEWKSPHKNPDPDSIPEVNNWWEIFNDPILNELEELAVCNSPNLFIALQRVEEARSLAGISKADLYPQLNLNPNFTSSVTLFELYGLSAIPLPAGTKLPNSIRIQQGQYNFPLNLSYEVDLWGKIRGQFESAVFNVEAEAWGYYSSLLTLTTDVANSYFLLRSLDAQIDLIKQTISDRQTNANLNQSRYTKGLGSLISVTEADLELTNTESIYLDTIRQRNLQENMIARLIGKPASEFTLEHNPLTEMPPNVPIGLPSSILLKRPDIAQAERRMESEHVLIGSAYASLFPSLSLTAAYGFASPNLKEFLTTKSRFWSYGENILQTVFDGFRKLENIELAKTRYREALGTYFQTILIAFQEVEDALNNLELQQRQILTLEKSVSFSKKTVELSQRRYRQGIIDYFEVITNQRTELDTERNFISLLGFQYQATVQLIKAMGGEWESPSSCPE